MVEWFGIDGNDDQVDTDPDPDVDTAERPTRDWFAPLSRIPRSALLVTIEVVIVGMIIAVSPPLLDRVQSDPLQADADQVTRLLPDSGNVIPEVFSENGGGSAPADPPRRASSLSMA